jgi:hypothetical protein
MKKILVLTILTGLLTGCGSQTETVFAPLAEQAAVSSVDRGFGDLIDNETFGLKKEATFERVMGNAITVKSDSINHDKNALLIYFSKGELTPGSHFHLVMDIKVNNDQFGKKGDAGIWVESSYFNGFALTKAEAARILKSATNYSKYVTQLDRILR